MAARILALVPRLVALTVIWLLATATFTFAAGNKANKASSAASTASASRPEVLVVPDVRGKAFVFAKGILQDAGFAWRVDGEVKGYAANTVSLQFPAPGAKVVDTGSPAVALQLLRNKDYGEQGLPEDTAPYGSTRLLLLSDWRKQHEKRAKPTTSTASTPTTTASSTTTTTEEEAPPPKPEPETRKPDFEVEGAPTEPADEIPLPERARRLEQRLDAAERPTKTLVNFWLYQHAWVVTGARFGWHDGAEALRILIRVDQKLEKRWGFGGRSEAVARSALAYVEAKAG